MALDKSHSGAIFAGGKTISGASRQKVWVSDYAASRLIQPAQPYHVSIIHAMAQI
jgi:hypothetical protein